MTNFNKLGQDYVSYASASGLLAYGTLNPQGATILSALRKQTIQSQRDQWQPLLTRDLLRLLSRLDTAFYYSARVADYLEEIRNLPGVIGELGANIPKEALCPPAQVTRNHRELGMEFESLILHSVAALDTLANLCAIHCTGCNIYDKKGRLIQIYFSNLQAALGSSVNSDARAQHLLALLSECAPTLSDIVLSIGRKTLRNHLAHETPIADLTESHFVIHWLDDGTVLRFDHEVYGMPLVASARRLIQTVSYLVTKSIAIFLAASDSPILQDNLSSALTLTRDLFEPYWTNPVISWRDYVSIDKNDPEFTVAKTESDGFTIQHVHLKPEIFEHAEPFTVNCQQRS